MPASYKPNPDHPLTTGFPYFPPEEQEWLQGELANILNTRLSMGPRVSRFEQDFAAYCGADYGVSFPSCTSALESALAALDVGPGDEVLVPVETFVATGMVVHLAGAQPVFTEVSDQTFGMDFEDAWSRVTDQTRGAIVVHFGGTIDPGLPDFIDRMHATGRFVIEDAAHAHGAELNGIRAGALADIGCFSFYSTKVMTTGEGGMLVTSRKDFAATARSLQNRGQDMNSSVELYELPGRNNRFTEIAAAMGSSQLRCLPDFIASRRKTAAVYDELLKESELFRPASTGPASNSSYWRYTVTSGASIGRDQLKVALQEDGISVDWPYDPPMHLQPVFQNLLGTKEGMLSRSEDLLSKHLCLPMHARLRDIDARFVVERLLYHGERLAVESGKGT